MAVVIKDKRARSSSGTYFHFLLHCFLYFECWDNMRWYCTHGTYHTKIFAEINIHEVLIFLSDNSCFLLNMQWETLIISL